MAKSFNVTRFLVKDRQGTEHYFISVVHPGDIGFPGIPGATIDYVSTKGLTLEFRNQQAPENPPDHTSIFGLGITDRTFDGKGTFKLTIVCRLPGTPDEEETVEISRVGGTGAFNDEKDLCAEFIGAGTME